MPMAPTLANGKICYIEMPATDIARSADFYKRVFGWVIRKRGDGSTAFDDTTGQVSGTWVLGRPPDARIGQVPLWLAETGSKRAARTGYPAMFLCRKPRVSLFGGRLLTFPRYVGESMLCNLRR